MTQLVVTDFDLATLGDEWETLVSAGQMIAEAHDRNRWRLGDLGMKVERRYGTSAIAEFALAINVRTSIMYDYTACSAFYGDEDRVAFPPLNWSHFRAAKKAKEHDIAMNWLAKAADNGWSVEDLNEALAPGSGGTPANQKLAQFGAEYKDLTPITDADGKIQGYNLVFRLAPEAMRDIDAALKLRTVYKVKVFGVSETGDDAS